MKRFALIMSAAVITVLCAGGVAGTISQTNASEASSTQAGTLRLQDAWNSAEALFERIDLNKDRRIDVDEFAAQTVVLADMVRSAGALRIAERDDLRIDLPEAGAAPLTPAERISLDAIARDAFYAAAEGEGSLTPESWIALKLRDFASADFDADGELKGRELPAYALRIARYEP